MSYGVGPMLRLLGDLLSRNGSVAEKKTGGLRREAVEQMQVLMSWTKIL